MIAYLIILMRSHVDKVIYLKSVCVRIVVLMRVYIFATHDSRGKSV